MIHVRRAAPADTRAMAELLNAIIEKGGTTALSETVSAELLSDWMAGDGVRGAWHVAEDEGGALLGFQWIGPRDDLPTDACDIATFVKPGQTQLGIGSQLFEATKSAARALGYEWINAAIRADNAGGLAYYQSRGFEDWKRPGNVSLINGKTANQVFKRYDLG
ncbi:GNAT family N-acetyltransferase [Marimonas arenosa]|uniref:GNAT family N-acetyltransferase n=1 Tax=Marimonas arenosa TaxID=1795305 RepID=A0AAE4B3R5_9RHOB|nr:GNAT family N-acetyltransferase [Marimonas arenosa]MDQ2090333.1 GNAT family N-acetyltransferase [Marimonas arenosa]